MRKNNIQLVQVNVNFDFDFLIENEDYDLIMNPIDDIFRNAEKIDNDNKKILPTEILKYMNFKNKEKYMITKYNITDRGNNIEIGLEMRLVS